MNPSVGRIVHYVSFGTPGGEYGKECRAAVVTEVDVMDDPASPPTIGLAVLNPTGLFFGQGLPYDATTAPRGGTWHWPERVDAPTT